MWVSAETNDLATRYAKIVVTDAQGRYLVPDLPPASYQLWVRGYGLADSVKTAARLGEVRNLTVRAASDAASAAPIVTGNLFDGVPALIDGKFVTLRIPYPLGFYAQSLEGRIDDAASGWQGRGLWVPSGDRTPWHEEDGKGSKPLVVQFQLWPTPLAH